MREGIKQAFARQLRRCMTDAEQRLWRHLRNRALAGWKFRRQHPVGPYVVDFICLEAGLVVEVDGGQHADTLREALRTRRLQASGYRVLRFWNNDVLTHTPMVLAAIVDALGDGHEHRPWRPPGAGE